MMTTEEILSRVASRVGWEGLSLTKDAYGDVNGLTNGSYTLFARVDEYECIWNIDRLLSGRMENLENGVASTTFAFIDLADVWMKHVENGGGQS